VIRKRVNSRPNAALKFCFHRKIASKAWRWNGKILVVQRLKSRFEKGCKKSPRTHIYMLKYDLFIYSRNQSSARNVIRVNRRRQILFFHLEIELEIETRRRMPPWNLLLLIQIKSQSCKRPLRHVESSAFTTSTRCKDSKEIMNDFLISALANQSNRNVW
jgi:hypothetical protein